MQNARGEQLTEVDAAHSTCYQWILGHCVVLRLCNIWMAAITAAFLVGQMAVDAIVCMDS